MKLFAKKTTPKKESITSPIYFGNLTKKEQDKALRQGAEKFSKEFTKVFEKLAKE